METTIPLARSRGVPTASFQQPLNQKHLQHTLISLEECVALNKKDRLKFGNPMIPKIESKAEKNNKYSKILNAMVLKL